MALVINGNKCVQLNAAPPPTTQAQTVPRAEITTLAINDRAEVATMRKDQEGQPFLSLESAATLQHAGPALAIGGQSLSLEPSG